MGILDFLEMKRLPKMGGLFLKWGVLTSLQIILNAVLQSFIHTSNPGKNSDNHHNNVHRLTSYKNIKYKSK